MRLTDITDRIRNFMHLDKTSGKSDETFADIESCLEQLGHFSEGQGRNRSQCAWQGLRGDQAAPSQWQ